MLNGKKLEQSKLVELLNAHFEGSTISGNVVTTADGKYSIMVDETLNMEVTKNENNNLETKGFSIRCEVEYENTNGGVATIKTYIQDDKKYETYEEFTTRFLATKSDEDVEEMILKTNKYLGTVEEFLEYKYGADTTKEIVEQMLISQGKTYRQGLEEMLVNDAGDDSWLHIEHRVSMAGGEGLDQPALENLLIELLKFNGTFEQLLASLDSSLNRDTLLLYAQSQGFRTEADAIKSIIAENFKCYFYTCKKGEDLISDANIDINSIKEPIYEIVSIVGTYIVSVKAPNGEIAQETVNISSITLDKTEIEKSIGTEITETITAVVEHIDGELTWESSNPDIARISGEGNTRTITIKPVEGEATITVSYGQYKAECKITVKFNHSEVIVPTIEATGNFANNPNIKEVRQGNIPIPTGFTYIKGDVYGGAVVQAPDRSEFVWVPVENAIYSSTNENVNKIPTSETNGSLKGYDYTPMGIQVDGEYKGLVYGFSKTGGAYLKYPNATNYQGMSGDPKEPDYLTSKQAGDASTDADEGINLLSSIVKIEGDVKTEEGQKQILDTWKTQLQNEYKEMIESVEKYGGFYVGRYETSLKEVTKEDGTKETVAQVKSGEQAATAEEDSANTWYGLYQKQKEYSEKNSLTNIVGSSMIWGSQYDQMMIWMQKNDIDVTEDFGDNKNLGTTDSNGNKTAGTTGTTPTDKINNIYDLYGNGYEWTLEALGFFFRVLRGGGCLSNLSPSVRHSGDTPYYTYSYYCSRSSLYIR